MATRPWESPAWDPGRADGGSARLGPQRGTGGGERWGEGPQQLLERDAGSVWDATNAP
jgi:hypothetical protein